MNALPPSAAAIFASVPTTHEALDAVESFTFTVTKPPSVNQAFVNRPAKLYSTREKRARGRGISVSYKVWRDVAGRELQAQGGAKAVRGPVAITVTIEDAGFGDLDNRLKCLLDLCVHHGIIEDDNRLIVRTIRARWGKVHGAKVEIKQASETRAEE